MFKTSRVFLVLSLLSIQSFGQEFDKKAETELLLNSILQQTSISKKIFYFPINITDYEFDGDYSTERVFPNIVQKDSTGEIKMISTICVVPIQFESSISSVLKEVDSSYDSAYYQDEIKKAEQTPWDKRNLNFSVKVKFVNWKWRKFHHETNQFSSPIFSKDGRIAMIKFGSINGKSMQEKKDRIWIFKKENTVWQVVQTINSMKNWN